MKFFFFIQLLVAVIYGCREINPDPMRELIPGTYIRFSQHEFGHEYDTLVISQLKGTVDAFTILRKWKYERVLDGKVVEPEYKRMVTTAVYDGQLLVEQSTGAVYVLDVRAKLLVNGGIKYQKV